jgi:hypothetical protein
MSRFTSSFLISLLIQMNNYKLKERDKHHAKGILRHLIFGECAKVVKTFGNYNKLSWSISQSFCNHVGVKSKHPRVCLADIFRWILTFQILDANTKMTIKIKNFSTCLIYILLIKSKQRMLVFNLTIYN